MGVNLIINQNGKYRYLFEKQIRKLAVYWINSRRQLQEIKKKKIPTCYKSKI